MKLLLDTNILIDFLRSRKPYDKPARLLLALGMANEFALWISPTQVGDLFYVLTKGGKVSLAPAVAEEIKVLRAFVHICPFGEQEADNALKQGWVDLGDALVYAAAKSINADAIITRNTKDFEKSEIPIFDCDSFFTWFKEMRGVSYAEIAT